MTAPTATLSDRLEELGKAATQGEYEWLTQDTISKFWARVERRDAKDCWPWVGTKAHRGGRGTLWVKFSADRKRPVLAPRISFLIHNGFLDAKLMVCHSCDNPNCVNPAHLWQGTAKDNSDDMHRKGRNTKPPGSKKRTHCTRGHELTEENTVKVTGGRACRTCKTEYHKAYLIEWRARKKDTIISALRSAGL